MKTCISYLLLFWVTLGTAFAQSGVRDAFEDLSKESRTALESAEPVFCEHYTPSQGPIYLVLQREWFSLPVEQSPAWIGTYGLGPCVGVAVVGYRDGKIVSAGLAHVDALTEFAFLTPRETLKTESGLPLLERVPDGTNDFFSRSLYGAEPDEVVVYLASSTPHMGTLDRIIQAVERWRKSAVSASRRVTYKTLFWRADTMLALNTRNGEVACDFDINEDMNWSLPEQHREIEDRTTYALMSSGLRKARSMLQYQRKTGSR